MSWEVGNQKSRKKQFVSNEDLLLKEGFLEEDQAKILLYQFLRNNISFSSELIAGVQLFPFQHMAINSMFECDYSLQVWSRGLSKCTNKDSLILTDHGIKKAIDVQIGDYVLAKDSMQLVESKTVNKKQKTYKITTNKGYESEGLDYHRILILNKNLEQEWKFAKDVSVGDCVIMRKNGELNSQFDIFDGFFANKKRFDQIIINPKNVSVKDWYYFFGLLIGDGCLTKKIVSITSADIEVENFLSSFCDKLNLNLRISNKKDCKAKSFVIANKSLHEFLEFSGFEIGKKAANKTIPYKLLNCSKENAAFVLRGLFDTDGHASTAPIRRNSNGVKIGFTSTSYELIKQVRFLLLLFGIDSSTKITFKGGESSFSGKKYICNKAWSINISTYNNIKIFKNSIGFLINRKQEKLNIIHAAKYINNEFSNSIPLIGDYLKKKYNKKSFVKKTKDSTLHVNFRKKTSRSLAEKLSAFVDVDDAKKINALLDDNLFFDFVKSKEESADETVDLQIANEHCYMSDGFINHNSFSCGLFAALDAIFNQGVHTGILSKSFRQCLEENEMVLTETGLKPIKDVQVGEKVQARKNLQLVKAKWENEPSNGISIITSLGFSLKGRLDHRVLVYNRETKEFFYKELKDINAGDCMPISKKRLKKEKTNKRIREPKKPDENSIKLKQLKCLINGKMVKRGLNKKRPATFTLNKKSLEQDKEFYFDEVVHVAFLNRIVTYDIEVDKEHCYWGNGFINHNSKMIFKKIEEIASKPEASLLKQCITKMTKGNDEWVIEMGKSKITALPLGDGEKLRGFRFQRIIIDEFLLMPERIYNEVIVPFLSVNLDPTKRKEIYDLETKMIEKGEMKEEDRHIWQQNKLIALSSASYKFEYLYKLYDQYDKLINKPDPKDTAKRCIIQLSYDCAPEQLYDQNLISQSRSTMSESQFIREFGAQFTDDSAGYFKISKMALCTIPDGEMPCVESQGSVSDEYIVSVDPSWAETESSDDFSIQVLKLNRESGTSCLVHSYALSGSPLRDHINYMFYVLKNFNVVFICMDYNGGVQFMNACNESSVFKNAEIELKTIEVDFDRIEEYQVDLQSAKNLYNKDNHRIVLQRKPSSNWIRQANELLQANFDHKRIFFASAAIDDSYRAQTSKKIGIENLRFSNALEFDKEEPAARMIDFVEHLSDMIELTKTECALIQISTSPQGTQSFDLPPNLKRKTGPDKPRKDSYSGLVLGNWAVKTFFDMEAFSSSDSSETFTPFFV